MVRQPASCPSTAAAGQDGDDAAYVVIVVDTLAGEVDAYGPMTLAEATSDMQVLRAELDADGAEFEDIVISIVELLRSARCRTWP